MGDYFKGHLGIYLALTGHRLKGYDLLHSGIATHFVDSHRLEQLEYDITQVQPSGSVEAKVKEILDSHQDDSVQSMQSEPQFSLNSQLDSISSIFGQPSIEKVFEKLESENSEWSQKTLALMRKFSPRSLKLSHKQLTKGKDLDFAGNLNMEHRLSVNCCEMDGDFIEGVRALLVDKDNSPQWSAPSVDKVEDSFVDTFFEPLDDELDVVAEKEKLFK